MRVNCLLKTITKLLCTISVILSAMTVCGCFSVTTPSMKEDTEQVLAVAQYGTSTLLVSEDGVAYIRGTSSGMANAEDYEALHNGLKGEIFLRIYDRGDATDCMLASGGGAVVTENGDVYVFTNDSAIKTPTYFASDTIKALPEKNGVFLLGTDGGLRSADYSAVGETGTASDDTVRLLCENIADFAYAPYTDELLCLTCTGELTVLDPSCGDTRVMAENIVHFDLRQTVDKSGGQDVVGSDVVCVDSMGQVVWYSHRTLADNSDVGLYACFEHVRLTVDRAPDEVAAVGSYDDGFALLAGDSMVVYGGDITGRAELDGEVVRTGVSAFDFDSRAAAVIVNGRVEAFGHYLDDLHASFINR